jgi:hypothetical protein
LYWPSAGILAVDDVALAIAGDRGRVSGLVALFNEGVKSVE